MASRAHDNTVNRWSSSQVRLWRRSLHNHIITTTTITINIIMRCKSSILDKPLDDFRMPSEESGTHGRYSRTW